MFNGWFNQFQSKSKVEILDFYWFEINPENFENWELSSMNNGLEVDLAKVKFKSAIVS